MWIADGNWIAIVISPVRASVRSVAKRGEWVPSSGTVGSHTRSPLFFSTMSARSLVMSLSSLVRVQATEYRRSHVIRQGGTRAGHLSLGQFSFSVPRYHDLSNDAGAEMIF